MKHTLLIITGTLLTYLSTAQIKKHFIDSLESAVANIKEELIKIKENYYVINPEGFAGNIGVYIGKEYVTLVDDQWSVLSNRIKEILGTITDKPVKYIINTHYHFDHADGNKAFGKQGVTIIAHENLRKRLSHDQLISGTGDTYGKILQKAYPPEALPSITFHDSLTLHDDQETIKIVHAKNAHSDGDVIVHFEKADIYHAGDIFITYGIPVIDDESGGNFYGVIKTIDHLIAVSTSETRFIPGHGPVCSVNELIAYRKLLVSIKDQVTDLIKKGMSLEKIITAVKTGVSTGGFKKEFISHVYRITVKENTKNPGRTKK